MLAKHENVTNKYAYLTEDERADCQPSSGACYHSSVRCRPTCCCQSLATRNGGRWLSQRNLETGANAVDELVAVVLAAHCGQRGASGGHDKKTSTHLGVMGDCSSNSSKRLTELLLCSNYHVGGLQNHLADLFCTWLKLTRRLTRLAANHSGGFRGLSYV